MDRTVIPLTRLPAQLPMTTGVPLLERVLASAQVLTVAAVMAVMAAALRAAVLQ